MLKTQQLHRNGKLISEVCKILKILHFVDVPFTRHPNQRHRQTALYETNTIYKLSINIRDIVCKLIKTTIS